MHKLMIGLMAAVTVIALSACGSDDKKAASSSTNTDTSSSTSTSSSSSDNNVSGDFCQQIASVDPVQVANDPTGAKKAAAELKKLDPPSEIADQWDDYIQAIEEIADTDPNDSAKLASIAQRHVGSFAAVGTYISKSCLNAFSGSIPNN